MKTIIKLMLSIALLSYLSACGYKGPLTLPKAALQSTVTNLQLTA